MKKLSALISVKVLYLLTVASVYAQSSKKGLLTDPSGVTKKGFKPENVPQLVINWIFLIATFLAVVYLMYGGIRYITSRGDKQGVEDARRHIVSAIIGLVIVLGTFGILQFVFGILGAENPLTKGLPTLQNVNK